MGYNTRPELISENAGLLKNILAAVKAKKDLKLTVPRDANISTEAYRLRRVLAATDHHRMAYGGEFAGLGQRTNLKVDSVNSMIIVSPKGTVRVEEFRATERDALDLLQSAQGTIVMMEFYPTPAFDVDSFISTARDAGWEIHGSTREVAEDGKNTFAAERLEESGFSLEDLNS